jgi:hypothetical protein
MVSRGKRCDRQKIACGPISGKNVSIHRYLEYGETEPGRHLGGVMSAVAAVVTAPPHPAPHYIDYAQCNGVVGGIQIDSRSVGTLYRPASPSNQPAGGT